MDRHAWDYTLFGRMSPDFIGGQELRVTKCEDSPPISKPIKAPSLEQLDFGKHPAKPQAKEASRKEHGAVKPCGPPRTVEEVETRNARKRRTRVVVLVELILLVALLLVANEFYGRPLRESRWLKMETYRSAIAGIFASDEIVDLNQTQPRVRDVKGIAYGNNKPSVMIGDQIMHQGDVISGVMVKEIGPEGVVFEADGHTWTQKVW